jgi:hypothetical protein
VFSLLAKPLTQLTQADQEWMWSLDQERAFEALKRILGSTLVLRLPDAQWPFQFHTDWSILGIGVVLIHKDDDSKEYVIAYASQSNNDAEAKYSSYEGEYLAIV